MGCVAVPMGESTLTRYLYPGWGVGGGRGMGEVLGVGGGIWELFVLASVHLSVCVSSYCLDIF